MKIVTGKVERDETVKSWVEIATSSEQGQGTSVVCQGRRIRSFVRHPKPNLRSKRGSDKPGRTERYRYRRFGRSGPEEGGSSESGAVLHVK